VGVIADRHGLDWLYPMNCVIEVQRNHGITDRLRAVDGVLGEVSCGGRVADEGAPTRSDVHQRTLRRLQGTKGRGGGGVMMVMIR
jgi:hypothetical protein